MLVRVMVLSLLPIMTFAHGVTSTTAKLEVRPNNLVELRVQFDLIELLNHQAEKYSLPQVASLTPETFGKLYQEVIKLFDKKMSIQVGDRVVAVNKRYPSKDQVLKLLKRELMEVNFSSDNKEAPYTFSDRRFYQQFFFDFRLNVKKDLKRLHLDFPNELGNIYLTMSTSKTLELHKGESWSPNQLYSHK
jgi:hypothetical protein